MKKYSVSVVYQSKHLKRLWGFSVHVIPALIYYSSLIFDKREAKDAVILFTSKRIPSSLGS